MALPCHSQEPRSPDEHQHTPGHVPLHVSVRGLQRQREKDFDSRSNAPTLAPATETASETGSPPRAATSVGAGACAGAHSEDTARGPGGGSDTHRLQDAPRRPGSLLRTQQASPKTPRPVAAAPQNGPELVINHLSGRVFKSFPELVTQIPRFADDSKNGLKFWFSNRGNLPRNVQISLRTPDGDVQYKGQLAGRCGPFSRISQ